MKDVLICEKRRRGDMNLWPGDVRMGKPSVIRHTIVNWIHRLTRRTGELKHLSTRGKEINRDSPVAASERGAAQSLNQLCVSGTSGKSGDTGWQPVHENAQVVNSKSRAGHVVSCLNMGDHPPRLNTPDWPIVNQYREGKAKRTPARGVKRTWNRVRTSGGSTFVVWLRTFV